MEKNDVHLVTVACDQNEDYEKEDGKTRFQFVDYATNLSYNAAVTDLELWQALKSKLKATSRQ